MNPDLDRLHPYPFERLRALLADATPPADRAHVALFDECPRLRDARRWCATRWSMRSTV